jgi:hypothetical protein
MFEEEAIRLEDGEEEMVLLLLSFAELLYDASI